MKAKTFSLTQVKALLHDPTLITFILIWVLQGIGGHGIIFVLPTVMHELGITDTANSQLMTIVRLLLSH
jgi:hypothetical protein